MAVAADGMGLAQQQASMRQVAYGQRSSYFGIGDVVVHLIGDIGQRLDHKTRASAGVAQSLHIASAPVRRSVRAGAAIWS